MFDVFIVIFTISRTLRLAVEARSAGLERSLATIILRDGDSPDIFYTDHS